MEKWQCPVCGYIYDPEKGDSEGGIAPGTPFEELPDDWVCPVCGTPKNMFEKIWIKGMLEYYEEWGITP